MIIHPGGESATFFSKKQFFYLRRALSNAFCIADTEAYIARCCPLVFEVVEFLITARIIDTPAHGFGGIQTSPSFLLCQYAPILLTGYYSAQRRQAKTLQRIRARTYPAITRRKKSSNGATSGGGEAGRARTASSRAASSRAMKDMAAG